MPQRNGPGAPPRGRASRAEPGGSAISVPAGLGPDGLPCAVQFVAPHHREDLVLGSALTVEAAHGTVHPPAFAISS
ncbi:hypothetical protein NRF20_05735 [Streptomyces sp. R-74717]|uniref:hypothetical protein n=1 Tax=Streptomyces TaxID=1883 RepID=UPI00379DA807